MEFVSWKIQPLEDIWLSAFESFGYGGFSIPKEFVVWGSIQKPQLA